MGFLQDSFKGSSKDSFGGVVCARVPLRVPALMQTTPPKESRAASE